MTPFETRMLAALKVIEQELADAAPLDRLRLHAFVVRARADVLAHITSAASTDGAAAISGTGIHQS